jgi:hypothetical protein
MNDIECAITILKDGQLRYQAQAGSSSVNMRGRLKNDPLCRWTIKRLEHWVKRAIAANSRRGTAPIGFELEDLQLIGTYLYQMLFDDKDLREHFEQALQNVLVRQELYTERRLRLNVIFEADADELAGLPWEFLFVKPENGDDGMFLAGERTELLLSRRIASRQSERRPESRPPKGETVTVLLVSCSPDKIGNESFAQISGQELKELKALLSDVNALSGSEQAPALRVVPLEDPTYDVLKDTVDTLRPQIVHYVGHGKPEHISMRRSEGDLEYDPEQGGRQFLWVNSHSVKSLFTHHQPRLVFFNACNTAVQSVDSLRSLARELIRVDVGGVIAMQYAINNQDAGLFAKVFYSALARGTAIDEAVRLGRNKIGAQHPPWSNPRFATPVVYIQNNEPIIDPPTGTNGDAAGRVVATIGSSSPHSSATVSGPLAAEAQREPMPIMTQPPAASTPLTG